VTAPAFGIVFRRVKTEVGSPSLYSQEADFSALGVGPNPAPVFAAPATQSNQAVNLGQFVSSLNTNGYLKLPGGLIIQWGLGVTAGGVGTITFPIAFPNAFMVGSMLRTSASATSDMNTLAYTANTKTTMSVLSEQANTTFMYIVLGY
jgi:hypothetical protein